MKMSDKREIAAEPATVYAALLDADVLKACVPGAKEVVGNPQEGYAATVVQKVGPVKATFKGRVTMSEMVENESLVIAGEGKSGAAGFARGGARVTLEPTADGGTVLSYDVEAKVGGKLAQMGSRLIDGFAKKMADQFFANLQEVLEGPQEAEGDELGSDDGTGEGGKGKKGWLRKFTGRG